MKYHALFVIFEKAAKFLNCRLLQIIGGALKVKIINLNWPPDKRVNHRLIFSFLNQNFQQNLCCGC